MLVPSLALTGCAGDLVAQGSESGCPIAFEFEGRSYYGFKTEAPIEMGRSLGDVPYSPCDDGYGGMGDGRFAMIAWLVIRSRALLSAGSATPQGDARERD